MSAPFASATPPQSRPRPTFACIRCADRKVKCDRQSPCSNCVKHNIECLYNPSHPTRKRQKRVKDQILTDRLQYYEALLKDKGIDPTKLPDTPESDCQPASSIPSSRPDYNQVSLSSRNFENFGATERISRTLVVHDQGRYKFVDK